LGRITERVARQFSSSRSNGFRGGWLAGREPDHDRAHPQQGHGDRDDRSGSHGGCRIGHGSSSAGVACLGYRPPPAPHLADSSGEAAAVRRRHAGASAAWVGGPHVRAFRGGARVPSAGCEFRRRGRVSGRAATGAVVEHRAAASGGGGERRGLWVDADTVICRFDRDIAEDVAGESFQALVLERFPTRVDPNTGVWFLRWGVAQRRVPGRRARRRSARSRMVGSGRCLPGPGLVRGRLPRSRCASLRSPSAFADATTWLSPAWNALGERGAQAPPIRHYAGLPYGGASLADGGVPQPPWRRRHGRN